MKHILQISLAGCCILGLFACSQPEQKEHTASKQNQSYKIIALSQQQLNEALQLPGEMEPFQFVQLFPKVSGFVKDVLVDRGTEVRKGQVLIRLEAPELTEHSAAARLKYQAAQAVFLTSKDRYMRLVQTSATQGAVSPYDLSSARSHMIADSVTYQGELSNYYATEDMKQYLVVTAPFDGVITERNVHPGALVGPGAQNGKPMLVLQQQSKLRMMINVPEQYSMQVKDKDQVNFTVNAMPGKVFEGVIARSSGSLNDNFRSETVEVDIDNSHHQFKAGMYAEVSLKAAGSVNAFVLPKTAIVTTTEKKYIVAVEHNQAHLIDVSEGNQHDGDVEVFGQLKPGEQVVANPSYKIKEGDSMPTAALTMKK